MFQLKVPGMYFYLGVNQAGADPATVVKNHSPLFFVNEDALPVGIKAWRIWPWTFSSEAHDNGNARLRCISDT